jgi:hypothetical protein
MGISMSESPAQFRDRIKTKAGELERVAWQMSAEQPKFVRYALSGLKEFVMWMDRACDAEARDG